MLTSLFSLITRNSPAARRAVWRFWYDLIGGRYQQTDWTFMNYGYQPIDPDELRPELGDFKGQDRSCIQMYDHLARSVDLRGKRVIEVGSGRGGGCSWLHQMHGPAKTRGVDFSDEAVQLCKKRHRVQGLSFVQGDAEDLPLPDEKIDAVFNVESSHCYGNRDQFFSEVFRVLKPGGHFLYTDFFGIEELEQARQRLAETGFAITTERDITPNVVKAMNMDHKWKSERIRQELPWIIAKTFGQFAGLKNSKVHRLFQSRKLNYLSWVLVK